MLHSCDKRLSLLYLLFEQTRVVSRNTSDLYQFNLGISFSRSFQEEGVFFIKVIKVSNWLWPNLQWFVHRRIKLAHNCTSICTQISGARLKTKENLLVARYLTQSPKRKTALSQEKSQWGCALFCARKIFHGDPYVTCKAYERYVHTVFQCSALNVS